MLARGVELVLSCRRPSPETHSSQRQLCAQRAHRGVPRDCLQPNMELPVTVAEGTGAAVRHLIAKSTSIHARPTARANSAAATSAPLRKRRPPSAHEAHAHQHHVDTVELFEL